MASAETGWIGRRMANGSLEVFTAAAEAVGQGLGVQYSAPRDATGLVYLPTAALHWATSGTPRAGHDSTVRNPGAIRAADYEEVLAYAQSLETPRPTASASVLRWWHPGGGVLALVVETHHDERTPHGRIEHQVHDVRSRYDPGYDPATLEGGKLTLAVPLGQLSFTAASPVPPDFDRILGTSEFSPLKHAHIAAFGALAFVPGVR